MAEQVGPFGEAVYVSYFNQKGWRFADNSIVPHFSELSVEEQRVWHTMADIAIDACENALVKQAESNVAKPKAMAAGRKELP